MLAVAQGKTVHFAIVLASIFSAYGYLFWQRKAYILINGMKMLRRLRWFFLSIVLIYGWMGVEHTNSPNGLSYGSVNWQNLQAGFYQISIIAVFTLTINLLLSTSSRDELIEGLFFLLFPLKLFGLQVGRIVIRIILVLEKVEETLLSLNLLKSSSQYHGSWFQKVAQTGGDAYCSVVVAALQAENREIIVELKKPIFLELVLPILLTVFFFIL